MDSRCLDDCAVPVVTRNQSDWPATERYCRLRPAIGHHAYFAGCRLRSSVSPSKTLAVLDYPVRFIPSYRDRNGLDALSLTKLWLLYFTAHPRITMS